ncbi:hypothetical protein B1A99_24800 [Cohnella sp. CIP 111063]|nr:hypothetical protein B1A99_24800 [Cohnella sp. CIP 111063]PRX65136.1 transcriptional regulator with XRE-family HTH domain [Cohnella sp. SGD-V74]
MQVWFDPGLSFGKMVKRIRRGIDGLTQKKLAELLGVTDAYISRLEADKDSVPTEEMIIKLASALGVNKYHLVLASGRIPTDFHQVFIEHPELLEEIIKRIPD